MGLPKPKNLVYLLRSLRVSIKKRARGIRYFEKIDDFQNKIGFTKIFIIFSQQEIYHLNVFLN